MHSVLITGITGFLGSHMAETLIARGVQVIGLKRPGSDTWRCKEFMQLVNWIDLDTEGHWKDAVEERRPDAIIHSAWIGVEATDRDNWTEQVKNLGLLADLLEVAKRADVKKFVFLGSQAEYGKTDGKVTEEHPAAAMNAYGAVKLAALDLLRTFSELNQLSWIWLRLFSLFGEKENDNWLIPSIIKKMKSDTEMDLTAGQQKYAYLYVKDFAKIMAQIVLKDIASGVYNISAAEVQPLRTLIEKIREEVNPGFRLKFGAVPYRNNQSMHIEGDITKITGQIGPIEFTDFNVALHLTIKHYLSK